MEFLVCDCEIFTYSYRWVETIKMKMRHKNVIVKNDNEQLECSKKTLIVYSSEIVIRQLKKYVEIVSSGLD